MRLSPIDHVFTGAGAYPINFLFFFDQHLDEALLKNSLEKCLHLFPMAAGQLEKLNSNTLNFRPGFAYGWNSQSVAKAPRLDDLSELGKYFKSAKSIPGEKLFEVTLTKFKEGSCLGVSISHCVVDGYSYFMFLTAWSKILRGLDTVRPELNREKLVPVSFPVLALSSDEIFEKTGFSLVNEKRPGDDSEVQWETIDYSKQSLKQLYAEVSNQVDLRLSMNDVLCADLWKKLVGKYQKSGDLVTLSCAFDFRRVYPASGPLYFGNAIRGASFQMSFDEAQQSTLGAIAHKIGTTVRSIGPKEVEDSLSCFESLRKERGLEFIEHFHVADPSRGFLFTNLSRLPLLDLDFGGGAPKDFRILTPAKRTCVILPLTDGLRVQIAH